MTSCGVFSYQQLGGVVGNSAPPAFSRSCDQGERTWISNRGNVVGQQPGGRRGCSHGMHTWFLQLFLNGASGCISQQTGVFGKCFPTAWDPR